MNLRKHWALLSLLPWTVFADDASLNKIESFDYDPRTIVQATTGSRQIAQADSMIPFAWHNNRLWYADIMAKVSTPNMQEANIGFGQRTFVPNYNFIWGTYGFVDVLSSRNDNIFQQFTLGAEYLSLTWDFRTNFYIPFGKKEYKTTVNASRSSVQLIGHDVRAHVVTDYEKSASGYDVEIGRVIPGIKDLRAYAAYYDFTDGIRGPRLRFEYEYTSQLSFNAAIQYDEVRDTQAFVGFSYTFGGVKNYNRKYPLLKRMMAPIVRDVDIVVVNDSGEDELIEYKDVYYAVDNDTGPGGDGTAENPYGSIQEALADPRTQGKKIHLKGTGTQEYDLGGETIRIDNGRSIIGNLDFYFDPDMNIPTNDALSPLPIFSNGQIVAENGSTLSGVILDGAKNNQAGIVLDGINANLENIVVRNYQRSAAIDLLNGANGNFKNVFVADNKTGIHVRDSNLTVTDSELRNNQQGLLVDNGNVDLVRVDIENNNKGLVINRGTVTLDQPEFIKNITAIEANNANISIVGGRIVDSQNAVVAKDSQLSFKDTRFNNNLENINAENGNLSADGIIIDGGKYAFNLDGTHLLLENSLVKNVQQGVVIRDGSLETNNNYFSDIDEEAIDLTNSPATLANDTITNVGTALRVNGETVTADNMQLVNNNNNVVATDGKINFNNSLIRKGLYAFDLENSDLTLSDSTLDDLRNAVRIRYGHLESSNNLYGNIQAAAVDLYQSTANLTNDMINNASLGINSERSTLNLNTVTLQNNTLALNQQYGKATIKDSLFKDNQDHILGNNTTLSLENSMITGGENSINVKNSDLKLIESQLIGIKNGLVIYDGSLVLKNSLLAQFDTSAISLYNSMALIKSSRIQNAEHGIMTTKANLDIEDSYIENNRGHGIDLQTGSLELKNSYLRYNGISGLNVSYHGHIDVINSAIDYNSVDGINIAGATQLHIHNSSVANNQRYGIRSNDVGDATLINESSLYGNGQHQIYTKNGLVAIHDAKRLQGTFASSGLGSITIKQHNQKPIIIVNKAKEINIGESV